MKNTFSYSVAESKAFGLEVFRAKLEEADPGYLARQLTANTADMVISRIDSAMQESLFEILAGLPHSYLADILVYYKGKASQPEPVQLPEGVVIEKAGTGQLPEIQSLIESVFSGYTNHYHSSPVFRSVDLAKGYLEWTLPYLEDEDKVCFLISDQGQAAGFLTARLYREEGYADIILNGVLPRFEGQGKYSFLLRHLKHFLHHEGIAEVVVSTQLNNHRVQGVWVKEGLFLHQSFYTFHHYISEKARAAGKLIA